MWYRSRALSALVRPFQFTFFHAKFESLCFQALLSHQRPSQSDLLVSFMYLVALTIDIFLSKFVSSYFHKHCSCSLAILCLSRALRTLVWPRYSDPFLPSSSLLVFTGIGLSLSRSAVLDLFMPRIYLVSPTASPFSLQGSGSSQLITTYWTEI